MARNRYRQTNVCHRCGCPLDAGEGRFCTDCLEEIREEDEYARKWDMTVQQVRELRENGLVSA